MTVCTVVAPVPKICRNSGRADALKDQVPRFRRLGAPSYPRIDRNVNRALRELAAHHVQGMVDLIEAEQVG